MHDRERLTERIRAAALEAGFDRCAPAPISALDAAPRLREWLRRGLHAELAWMERDTDRRTDPTRIVDGARCVLMLARDYLSAEPATEDPTRARISRYAWGDEYHDVLGADVKRLYERIREIVPGCVGRYYVDTGPIMEKAWAEVAGLGWIGKHTNVLTTGGGSWFFLAAIVLDVELAYGAPERDHCGSCRACIDVCPTDAIIAPYVLDARRCISYLTIEHRGAIPVEYRAAIGNRIFGCDDCQDVCPWNRFARVVEDNPFEPRDGLRDPTLSDLLALDEDGWRRRFRRSPVKRAKYAGFLRNVAVALGNSGDRSAVPGLARRLDHPEPVVRSHVAWALGRLGGEVATRRLQERRALEAKEEVCREIDAAIAEAAGTPPSEMAC